MYILVDIDWSFTRSQGYSELNLGNKSAWGSVKNFSIELYGPIVRPYTIGATRGCANGPSSSRHFWSCDHISYEAAKLEVGSFWSWPWQKRSWKAHMTLADRGSLYRTSTKVRVNIGKWWECRSTENRFGGKRIIRWPDARIDKHNKENF